MTEPRIHLRDSIFDRVSRRWRLIWARWWVPLSGRSPAGRVAARLAVWFSPPYKARLYLAQVAPKGFISPYATVYHPDLRLGKHVFVGDHVIIYQNDAQGRIELGDGVRVFDGALLETGHGGAIRVGAGSRIHRGCQLVAHKGAILIGRDVGLAPSCALYAYNHGVAPTQPISTQPLQTRGPIVIEDHAWLGVGVIVLDGVRIGTGAVIGAGAVVTEDIPANAIAAGVPARVVATRASLAAVAAAGTPQGE